MYFFILRIIARLFPGLINSKMKTRILKRCGIEIGKGTVFFDAGNICVDCSRPALLKIGEYCKITSGVIILTHDYSRAVLRRAYGEVIGEARRTEIGDNVFIGMNSIILMGTKIGNNCIVGAGSVCHGTYPDNSVIGGNPARVICGLEEYYLERKKKTVQEAIEYALVYKDKYGAFPSIQNMGAFFPLYLPRTLEALRENGIRTNLSADVESEVIEHFMNTEPMFENYDAFLEKVKEYEK